MSHCKTIILYNPLPIKFVTLINRMNHNRSPALERSVINYWGGGRGTGGGGGGALPGFMGSQSRPQLLLGLKTYSQLFGPREGFLTPQWIIAGKKKNKSQINTTMKIRWGLDRNVLRPTPGDPWGVEQHHWNTGANQQLNPGVPSNRQKSSGPNQLKLIALCRGNHWVWRPTHWRAIKEGSKVINRDWGNH